MYPHTQSAAIQSHKLQTFGPVVVLPCPRPPVSSPPGPPGPGPRGPDPVPRARPRRSRWCPRYRSLGTVGGRDLENFPGAILYQSPGNFTRETDYSGKRGEARAPFGAEWQDQAHIVSPFFRDGPGQKRRTNSHRFAEWPQSVCNTSWCIDFCGPMKRNPCFQLLFVPDVMVLPIPKGKNPRPQNSPDPSTRRAPPHRGRSSLGRPGGACAGTFRGPGPRGCLGATLVARRLVLGGAGVASAGEMRAVL